MILVDTSVLIEYFRRKDKQNTFFYHLSSSNQPLAISSITLYEVFVGSNPEQDSFWQQLLSAISLIPFGSDEATEAVLIQKELLRKNKAIGFGDIAIAATAKVNKMELATLNKKDFLPITGLKLF